MDGGGGGVGLKPVLFARQVLFSVKKIIIKRNIFKSCLLFYNQQVKMLLFLQNSGNPLIHHDI